MEDDKYQKLHDYPKTVNRNKIYCAPQGEQKIIKGHATFDPDKEFRVIQVRKGHIRKNDLSYVLMYNSIMLRVDLIGATHRGIPTPHVHIFDEKHDNGLDAIPLSDIENYDQTSEIIESLTVFLKYNNFELNDLSISLSTV